MNAANTANPVRRVGVAALSGPCDPDRLEAGLQAMRHHGLEPGLARNVAAGCDASGVFAGGDDERLDGFHELLADAGLDAVVFARGGHGVLRLLPRLDWGLIGRRVRSGLRLCGYSDLTPLLLEVTHRFGVPTLHGPMVAVDLARGLTSQESESWLRNLAGEHAAEHVVERREPPPPGPPETVEGRLLGGCLSLLAATLGTAFAPRLGGGLVCLEAVDEPGYARDRMFPHLRLSGTLNGARAVIFGHFEPAVEGGDASWNEVLRQVSDQTSTAIATGLAAGHGVPNLTLPLGAASRLTEDGRLVVGVRRDGR